ncbi:hypothetical protein PMAYCL1PPCAC_13091, partial [Pristionchus mayeri]
GSTKGAHFTEEVSMEGKVVAVTGVNTGIGLETAKELNLRGAKVYMLCRSEKRAEEGKKKMIESGCDGSRLIFSQCDLSKFASVRRCAERMIEAEPRLDVLVNNAGIMFYPQFELTEDGHEMTWQSNHLGPFLLTELLLPLLRKAEEGRIVCVSSAIHHKSEPLDFSTIDSESSFSRLQPYNRSKLANVMYARDLARRLREEGVTNVTVNSLHPGVVATELPRHLPFFIRPLSFLAGYFMKSEKDGAQTSLYLSMANEVKGVSGGYYDECARAKESRLARDDETCKRLYEYSKKAVGLEIERAKY